MIYLYSLIGLGGLAALVYVVRSIKSWGNAEIKQDIAEKESANDKKELQSWLNRPRFDADVVKRLRDAAKNKRP